MKLKQIVDLFVKSRLPNGFRASNSMLGISISGGQLGEDYYWFSITIHRDHIAIYHWNCMKPSLIMYSADPKFFEILGGVAENPTQIRDGEYYAANGD